MIELNKIYCGNCLDILPTIDSHSVDLTITSPPYNVNLGGKNKCRRISYDIYNDNQNHDNYINFLKSVFFEIYRISKIGARTVINIGDGANGSISTSSDVIHFMKDIGFSTYTHIIWNKHQVSNRTSWGSWLSPSCPSFPIPYEHILIFYKKSKKLNHKGITDLLRDEFIKWAYGIWEFAPEKRQKKMGHNAIFPLELPKRCIKMLSYINDIIIDPFNGLGTTTLAAKQLNRKFIGIEISENYCKIANERLAN